VAEPEIQRRQDDEVEQGRDHSPLNQTASAPPATAMGDNRSSHSAGVTVRATSMETITASAYDSTSGRKNGEVALAHCGRIWVDSSPGGGSAFSLALPSWRSLQSETPGAD
jgi:hypothetical protein